MLKTTTLKNFGVLEICLLAMVGLYTSYPFLMGVSLLNTNVPGEDAEMLASIVERGIKPYRYYGQYLYLVFTPQLYYYLTPAIIMLPSLFMKCLTWFIVWISVVFGAAGYVNHILMGSFLPAINYIVFIPLNLYLLSKGHYKWLVLSMFGSLMFHGSSGMIIQFGTFLCMLTRLGIKDWIRIIPLGVLALAIYIINHQIAPSIASIVVANLETNLENPEYNNYLTIIHLGGIKPKDETLSQLANIPGLSWFLYYLGLQVVPAIAMIAIGLYHNSKSQIPKWLLRFTILPIGLIIVFIALPEMRPQIFNILDRASNALSIILFMTAGLLYTDLRKLPSRVPAILMSLILGLSWNTWKWAIFIVTG